MFERLARQTVNDLLDRTVFPFLSFSVQGRFTCDYSVEKRMRTLLNHGGRGRNKNLTRHHQREEGVIMRRFFGCAIADHDRRRRTRAKQ